MDILFVMVLTIIGLVCCIGGTIFWIWMIIDCATKEPEGSDKIVWIVVIVLGHFIGSLIYFFVRRPTRMQQVGA